MNTDIIIGNLKSRDDCNICYCISAKFCEK